MFWRQEKNWKSTKATRVHPDSRETASISVRGQRKLWCTPYVSKAIKYCWQLARPEHVCNDPHHPTPEFAL